jgi:hypothetical protein
MQPAIKELIDVDRLDLGQDVGAGLEPACELLARESVAKAESFTFGCCDVLPLEETPTAKEFKQLGELAVAFHVEVLPPPSP